MITSNIGRIFLDAYNEEYGTGYDARTFFLEQFYPLFFDHNKQMMNAINSPFVQKLPSCRDCIKGIKKFETIERRSERLKEFLDKVENNEADMSIAIGYPSVSPNAKTSGQVTDLKMRTTKEDIFLSWIGGALGITVRGPLSILFSHKKILLDISKGWRYYRDALNDVLILDGNKINSWNGQWLSHFYNQREYDEENPFANFSYSKATEDGLLSVEPQTWTKILIAISRRYNDEKLLAYIYQFEKSNTTIGFIPFDLTQIRRPIHLYEKIFGMDNGRDAESLWGTEIGFKTACTSGVIGVKAMEPKGLRDYVYKGKMPKTPNNEENIINFNVYKIWILAMLNNDALWEKSLELAELLNEASSDEDKSISTKRKNLVEAMLKATNKKLFVEAATEIVRYISKRDEFTGVVKEIHSMPADNVPYFLTLLRFQYETLK